MTRVQRPFLTSARNEEFAPCRIFGPNIRQGANSSFLAQVKGGKWVRVTEPLSF